MKTINQNIVAICVATYSPNLINATRAAAKRAIEDATQRLEPTLSDSICFTRKAIC